MSELPAFTADGTLPPGEHRLALDCLLESVLVLGPSNRHPEWDERRRAFLARNFARLVLQLWEVGVDNVFLVGSFATLKNRPGDIDGYFECSPAAFVDICRRLNTIEETKCWLFREAVKPEWRSPWEATTVMWREYRVDLRPFEPPDAEAAKWLRRQRSQRQWFPLIPGWPTLFRLARDRSREDYFLRERGIVRIVRSR